MVKATLQFDDVAAMRLAAIYSTADVVAQRKKALSLLSLTPGAEVLDIGAGPGFLCEDMADLVGPGGRVAGIDVSDSLVDFARGRNKRTWLTYAKGDATSIPFPDCSFDISVCTQVLEYVTDVDRALTEICRVLRPLGRALILDADWDTVVWHSADPERMARMLKIWEAHCSDPRLPRTLAPRLQAAGLRVDAVRAFSYVNTRLDDQSYSTGLVDLIANFVTQRNSSAQDEASAWVAELHSLSDAGRYFFSSTRYFFLASKSAA